MNQLLEEIKEKIDKDSRLEKNTKSTILEKLDNVSGIDDYLGHIDMKWTVEPESAILNSMNPTLLTLVLELQYEKIAKKLIYAGANYLKPDKGAMTPIMFASHHGFESIVDILLKKELISRQHLNLEEEYEANTAITLAMNEGHNSIALKLYKKGAREGQQEEPVITIAIKNIDETTTHNNDEDKQLALIKEFVKNGENINRQANTYPLHQSCQQNHMKITEFLVENGAILDVRDYENDTPLQLACNHDDMKIAEFLVKKGANVRMTTNCGEKLKEIFQETWKGSTIESAVYDNNLENVKTLLLSNFSILNAINNAYLLDRKEIISLFESRPDLYYLKAEKGNQNIWTIAASSGNKRLLDRLKTLSKQDNARKTISRFIKRSTKSTRKLR
jgi:ankyrin repeat protein